MSESEARRKGMESYRKVFGFDRSRMATPFDAHTVDYLYGEIWTRPGLETRERSLLSVAVLAAMGRENELRTHLKGLRHQGFTRAQVTEIMLHVAHYAGWPAGNAGMRAADEVFPEGK